MTQREEGRFSLRSQAQLVLLSSSLESKGPLTLHATRVSLLAMHITVGTPSVFFSVQSLR